MRKKHLVVLYPHIGLLKNIIRQKNANWSNIVIYSSASGFIRILQSKDVFERLSSCGARVQVELPLTNAEFQLSGKVGRLLRRLTVRVPISFQEWCVLLASAIAPNLKLGALHVDSFDELTIDASLDTAFLLRYLGKKNPSSRFFVNVLSHSHSYPESVVLNKKQSLVDKSSKLGISSPIGSVVSVRSESLYPCQTSHSQLTPEMPYLVVFQRSPDQYINKNFMFSVFTEILEWGCRNGIKILIKPHLWPNRRFLTWYFHWRFIRRLPIDLTYSEPEALIDGALGAICFYSSILHEISSRQKPGLQAVSDRALPTRLLGPNSIVKAFSVPEVRKFLEGLQTA